MSGRALATGTAWAGLCLVHHHRTRPLMAGRPCAPCWPAGFPPGACGCLPMWHGVSGFATNSPSFTISKILNNHLSTEPRVSMWGRVQAGTLTCGCGQVSKWSDRDDVGPLQCHFLQCTLAAETSVRRRWRAAIKRTIVAAAPDLIVVESVPACWTHLTDGTT